MKKSLIGLLILFFFFTTFTPKSDFNLNSKLYIQKIKIEDNSVIEADEIKEEIGSDKAKKILNALEKI